MRGFRKWDQRFLGMAQHISNWSHDPSTKVGAVIVAPNRTIVSLGYNGFPRGVDDLPERYADREVKYKYVVHAEMNAILTAGKIPAESTLYTFPLFPCNECAKAIIQSGIFRVVGPKPDTDRWGDSHTVSNHMFKEAGVRTTYLNLIAPHHITDLEREDE